MTKDPPVFVLADSDPTRAAHAFHAVASAVFAQVPYAEVVHVGSTAIPDCLTKGDLDVLVRVSAADFDRASHALDAQFDRSNRNEATADYVEYDFRADGLEASLQLTVAGSDLDDHFYRVKAVLSSDTDALERYNSLKLEHQGKSMKAYRLAKEQLIEEFLGMSDSGEDSGNVCLKPGIYE